MTFPTTQAPHLSSKYVHVDTNAIIDMMKSEGFYVAEVKKDRPRKLDPQYTRHMVDFRPHNALKAENGYTPRLLFTNSANGTSGASSMIGVYRFVCSNGLIVGSTYAKESVRHLGDPAKNILEQARSLAHKTSRLFSQIEQWQVKQLTRYQQEDLAKAAMALRFGTSDRFSVQDVLQVRRQADDNGSLWGTFNRVQESISQGGLTAYVNRRRTTSRQLKSISLDTEFNTKLWSLAESYV